MAVKRVGRLGDMYNIKLQRGLHVWKWLGWTEWQIPNDELSDFSTKQRGGKGDRSRGSERKRSRRVARRVIAIQVFIFISTSEG